MQVTHNDYTNALIHETSPYLLQHAHNPVNWYPWGIEALQKAKDQDLPILVSIGYSACHWCHVMERESFEDATVAAYMNKYFINIKIDREERPDLDHLYMDALQALSGSGGWPLNVFLTPDGRPFYGGTYFPPQKAFNRISWQDVLSAMTDVWTNKRSEVEAQADKLIAHIKRANQLGSLQREWISPATFYQESTCSLMANNLLLNADTRDGGFGKAPKFLQTYSVQYLLQYHHLYKSEEAREQAVLTLRKMLHGGIYDQLGGGISRYSTDNEWLAPHFEKMLYDNALFVMVLSEAYQATKDNLFKEGIQHTLSFLLNELKDPKGGFYTALDADSEGVEGKFYTWSKEEVEAILGEGAALFCEYYNISEAGNWEHTNILHVTESLKILAARHGLAEETLKVQMAAYAQLLLDVRQRRIRPGTDDKILLSCNALLINAFCKAASALGEESYLQEAIDLYKFVQENFKDKSETFLLLHSYKNADARYPAFLDDYAYLIQAGIALQEATGNQQYLLDTQEYCNYVLEHFADVDSKYLFFSHAAQQDIVVRKLELYDGATPSANAIMAENLLYLGVVFNNTTWLQKGAGMLQGMSAAMQKHPGSFAVWAGIYLRQTAGINEIVITGKNIMPTLKKILCYYFPNKIVQSSTEVHIFPLLQHKDFEYDVKLYLCRDYACKPPVYSAEDLLNKLKKSR
jgi:hypothetical protein